MKVLNVILGAVAVAALSACGGGSSGMAGNSAPAAAVTPPATPLPVELAAFARAGMVEQEDSTPRALNDVQLTSNEEGPSEFDDWFQ